MGLLENESPRTPSYWGSRIPGGSCPPKAQSQAVRFKRDVAAPHPPGRCVGLGANRRRSRLVRGFARQDPQGDLPRRRGRPKKRSRESGGPIRRCGQRLANRPVAAHRASRAHGRFRPSSKRGRRPPGFPRAASRVTAADGGEPPRPVERAPSPRRPARLEVKSSPFRTGSIRRPREPYAPARRAPRSTEPYPTSRGRVGCFVSEAPFDDGGAAVVDGPSSPPERRRRLRRRRRPCRRAASSSSSVACFARS